jgi:hypothetical protein
MPWMYKIRDNTSQSAWIIHGRIIILSGLYHYLLIAPVTSDMFPYLKDNKSGMKENICTGFWQRH